MLHKVLFLHFWLSCIPLPPCLRCSTVASLWPPSQEMFQECINVTCPTRRGTWPITRSCRFKVTVEWCFIKCRQNLCISNVKEAPWYLHENTQLCVPYQFITLTIKNVLLTVCMTHSYTFVHAATYSSFWALQRLKTDRQSLLICVLIRSSDHHHLPWGHDSQHVPGCCSAVPGRCLPFKPDLRVAETRTERLPHRVSQFL